MTCDVPEALREIGFEFDPDGRVTRIEWRIERDR